MKMNDKVLNCHPLMCWDIVMQQREMYEMPRKYAHLFDLQQAYGWSIALDQLLSAYFDTIILTDPSHEIVWVSEGFKRMTGYAAEEAIGRTPVFLQGEATSLQVKKHMREQLSVPQPVKGKLANYKKDGSLYLCLIQIIPLFNKVGALTHFMALEKELTNEA
jgi:PAS domain S-box-containing protein